MRRSPTFKLCIRLLQSPPTKIVQINRPGNVENRPGLLPVKESHLSVTRGQGKALQDDHYPHHMKIRRTRFSALLRWMRIR